MLKQLKHVNEQYGSDIDVLVLHEES